MWINLENIGKHNVPLPRSDSAAAKDMRCAIVLTYLFQLLDDQVFQPCYILDENCHFRRELLQEAVRDSRSESFRRAFLLSLCTDEQARILQERKKTVTEGIMSLGVGLVESADLSSLEQDVRDFVDYACKVWRTIQRLQDRFEPNMEYTVDREYEWKVLEFESDERPKTNSTLETVNSGDDHVLVVFPRMYIVQQAEPRPVTPGVTLRKSQTLEAGQELRTKGPSALTFGRYPSAPRADRFRKESLPAYGAKAGRNAPTFLA